MMKMTAMMMTMIIKMTTTTATIIPVEDIPLSSCVVSVLFTPTSLEVFDDSCVVSVSSPLEVVDEVELLLVSEVILTLTPG